MGIGAFICLEAQGFNIWVCVNFELWKALPELACFADSMVCPEDPVFWQDQVY